MIDGLVQRLALSVKKIRKTTGQYKGVREFLGDTYGLVELEPIIKESGIWSINNRCRLIILHKSLRNDKIQLLTDGLRTYAETMCDVMPSEYREKKTTMNEDLKLMADQRARYITDFYGRRVTVAQVKFI